MLREACSLAQLSAHDVDCVLVHQANLRIVKRLQERTGIAPEKWHVNIGKIGNTATPRWRAKRRFLPHAGANANVVRRTGQTYTPLAIIDQCAYKILRPGPRTSNGSSILTRPSVGRS